MLVNFDWENKEPNPKVPRLLKPMARHIVPSANASAPDTPLETSRYYA